MRLHVLVSIVLVVALLAAAGGVAALLIASREPVPGRAPPKVVSVVQAPPIRVHENHQVRISGLGTVRAKIRVSIIPEVAGKVVVKADNFQSGGFVSSGQVLLEIEKTDYQQALDSAERRIELIDARLKLLDQEAKNVAVTEKIERGQVDLAQKSYDRLRQLYETGAATENEVDTAREALLARQQQLQGILNQQALVDPQRAQLQAERAVAEVEKNKAATALKRTTILCPVDGRVLSVAAEAGQRIGPGAPCGEVYGLQVMEVPVSVPAGDLAWIDPQALAACSGGGNGSQPAEARVVWSELQTGRAVSWRGCLARIEAGLEAATRTAVLVVEVSNPKLQPGASAAGLLDLQMFCDVTVFGKTVERAILLPRSAIRHEDAEYVWLARSDGDGFRLARSAVTVARYTEDEAMIIPGEGGGLTDGDRVVIGAMTKPVVGMAVEPLDTVEAATAPAPAGPATREVVHRDETRLAPRPDRPAR